MKNIWPEERSEPFPDRSERRHVARLFVPRYLRSVELEMRETILLDLSPAGARIEHRERLHQGFGCFVDLPRAFGRLRLSGRVVWTRHHRAEQTPEGERQDYYQSGVAFTNMTPAQQSELSAAVASLRDGRETAWLDNAPNPSAQETA